MAASTESRMHLSRLTLGFMPSFALRAAAQLRLADAFDDGARHVRDIAHEVKLPVQTTNRLLRALAGLGLFIETEPAVFTATEAGRLLRSDHPESMRAFIEMFTDPIMTRAWEELAGSVRTENTSFDDIFGASFFAHLEKEPAKSALFNASMSEATASAASGLAEAYDFGRYRTIVDVGGGDGTLLSTVLAAHSGPRGVVFDSAEGGAQAAQRFTDAGLADRGTVAAGDFFSSVPEGGDLYLLKSIIHDWDDDRSVTILRHCRDALPRDGRLLVIEPVLPATVDPQLAGLYLSDLNMLVNVGGRERTLVEFTELLHRAGFTVSAAEPVPPGSFWFIEGTPTS